MTRVIVSDHAVNGISPHHGRPGVVVGLQDATRERRLAPFRADVDHLAELRGLIRRAQEQERQLTGEILHAMDAAGVSRLEGEQAVAIRDTRTTLRPDVGLFLEALGPRAHEALAVNITAARRLIGADDLAAISETATTPVLRVEPLAATDEEGM